MAKILIRVILASVDIIIVQHDHLQAYCKFIEFQKQEVDLD